MAVVTRNKWWSEVSATSPPPRQRTESMDTIHLHLQSETDTEQLGAVLASMLPAGTVVALHGTLGAGKTRLVRSVAAACGVPAPEVTSPTFTLWQTYEGTKVIHHLDAYRIHDDDEFLELGVEECFDGEAIVFIEWARRVEACLPKEHLSIHLDATGDTCREVRIETDSPELGTIVEQLRDRH